MVKIPVKDEELLVRVCLSLGRIGKLIRMDSSIAGEELFASSQLTQ
jgi:hypothetical protein